MRTIFSGCILMIILCSQAQNIPPLASAKSLGFGNASVAFADQWSIFNNVGGLARSDSPGSVFSIYNLYQLNALNSAYAGFIYPWSTLSAGASFIHFGDKYYQQNQFGIGFGHRFGITSWGFKLNYHQSSFHGYRQWNHFILELGAITSISEHLNIGVHLYNLTNAVWNPENNLTIPIVVRTGISYHPSESFWWNFELEKRSNHPPNLKTGMLFYLTRQVFASLGYVTNPSSPTLGIGFSFEKIEIEYGSNWHQVLGLSHLFGISYRFKKLKNEDHE